MNRIRAIIAGVASLIVLVYLGWLGFKWGAMRVYVGPEQALVVINKFGPALPPDRITVPAENNNFKGVQEEVRGPGRYFLNPIEYDWELVDLVQIPAGDPQSWDWDNTGQLKNPSSAPMVGLVSLKEGKNPPAGQEIVDANTKGIQRVVLTPGTYKINKHRMEVQIVPAVVVPPGSVGVVTQLVGDIGLVKSATLTEIRAGTTGPITAATPKVDQAQGPTRLVVGTAERGILRDVIQPGIYYLNPRMVKVTIVPVGYDAITLQNSEAGRTNNASRAIRFLSKDGYQVETDFTVVWGRSPADAPNIVANIGTIDKVTENVIEPAMKAACQNEGAKYSAKELIQGQTRSQFQDALSAALEKHVASRNIHVLLALIRNISIKDSSGRDQTDGLLGTIQRANIEVEKELTNKQKTATAAVKASHEQALKLIDVARETVTSETNVLVANLLAESAKKAAEIDAQRELDVASINLEIAQLDAKRVEILGKAGADVERLKNEAKAKGAKLLVDALGSPQAYNKYTFAKNFEPTELRLIFAGPGTFWTDLKSFQDVGAAKMVQGVEDKKP